MFDVDDFVFFGCFVKMLVFVGDVDFVVDDFLVVMEGSDVVFVLMFDLLVMMLWVLDVIVFIVGNIGYNCKV